MGEKMKTLIKCLLILTLTVWFWEDSRGTWNFVEDKKKIPEIYKEEATTWEVGDLEEYEYFTPADQSEGQ